MTDYPLGTICEELDCGSKDNPNYEVCERICAAFPMEKNKVSLEEACKITRCPQLNKEASGRVCENCTGKKYDNIK